jgi:glycosyl hydrolase family 65
LVEEARLARRVGGPRRIAEPAALLAEVVGGLFGARSDVGGGRFELAPWLPEGWRTMALRRLRLHRTLLDVEVRPRAEWATVRLAVSFGPPIAVDLWVRNTAPVARVMVDEIELAGPRAIFTVQGEHEARFFFGGEAR